MKLKRRNLLKAGAVASLASLATNVKAAFVRKPAARTTFGSKKYEQIVRAVRNTFPSPTHDGASDSRFSRLFSEALGIYEGLKSNKTFIGKRGALDYKGARKARMATEMGNARAVIRDSAKYLEGIFTWSHPDVHRLHGSATGVSIIGQFYGALVDANLVWDDLSQRVAEAEVKAVSMCAALVGYDPDIATGVFTFGGTGTTLYGVKIGLETAQPGAFQNGVKQQMRVLSSDVAHYASISAVAWTGMGAAARERLAMVNDFNKKVYDETRRMAEAGDSPVFVETTRYRKTAYGEAIVGIKVFTLSIFTDPDAIDNVFTALDTARNKVLAGRA